MSNELEDIIRGCCEKKYKYQKKLYDKYSSLLYAICLRYFKNADDACDGLQEGFIKIYDKIADYKGEGSFEGWIKRVQVNICLMELRKKKRLVFSDHMDEEIADEPSEDEQETNQVSATELMDVIAKLPVGYRTVFNLYVIDGLSHREISEALGISEGTSKSQLARAKKILRDQLQQRVNE